MTIISGSDRVYVGQLISPSGLRHYGVGPDNNPPGRGSGRYPKGSGKRPYQHTSNKQTGVSNVIPVKARHFIQDAVHIASKAYMYYNVGLGIFLSLTNPASLAVTATTLPYVGKDIYARFKTLAIENRKAKGDVDKKTGFKLKNREYSAEEDCENVNPMYGTGKPNATNNCMLCTATFDMRRRGYDVTAKTSYDGYTNDAYKEWYPKSKCRSISKDGVLNELKKQGDGARGNLMFGWNLPFYKKVISSYAGHSVAYEVKNGNVVIYDAQSGKVYNNPEKLLRRVEDEVEFIRLDNCKFDPIKIRECCA